MSTRRAICTGKFNKYSACDTAVFTAHVCRYTEKDIQESPLNGFPPFWAFLWPGGYGLTRYLQENDFLFKDQRATVFDFGCGCGSASIAARQAGAAAVIANDIDPLSVLATAMNCEDNKELKPRHAPLIYGTTHDWLSVSAGELFSYVARCEANAATSQNTADLISSTPKRVLLVGDMLYDYEIGPRVLNLVNDVVGEGWDVYIGDPGRDFANRHLDKVANSEVVAEYELPSEIRSQNNGLLSVRVRSISRR